MLRRSTVSAHYELSNNILHVSEPAVELVSNIFAYIQMIDSGLLRLIDTPTLTLSLIHRVESQLTSEPFQPTIQFVESATERTHAYGYIHIVLMYTGGSTQHLDEQNESASDEASRERRAMQRTTKEPSGR